MPSYPLPLPRLQTQTPNLLPPNTHIQVSLATPERVHIFSKKLNKNSPYIKAYGHVKDGNQRYARMSDDVKLELIRTRGTWGGVPTPVAHVLLTAVRRATTQVAINNACTTPILSHLGLVHKIPPIPFKRKTTYRTSLSGIELMESWCEADKKFQKFFDAYVTKTDIDRARGWATTLQMGLELDMIVEAQKAAEEAMEQIEAQKAAQMAQQTQTVQWAYTGNPNIWTYDTTTGIATTATSSGTTTTIR